MVGKSLYITRGINKVCRTFEREHGMEDFNRTNLPFSQSAHLQEQSLGFPDIYISDISAIPCQSPKRPMRLGVIWNNLQTASRLAFLSKTSLCLNHCFEYPVFALVGSFPTHTIYLNFNSTPNSLVRTPISHKRPVTGYFSQRDQPSQAILPQIH